MPRTGLKLYEIPCDLCKKENREAFGYPQDKCSTMMGYPSHKDRHGRFHDHDRNDHGTRYECAKGHSWDIQSSGACWCGWPEIQENEDTKQWSSSFSSQRIERLSEQVRNRLEKIKELLNKLPLAGHNIQDVLDLNDNINQLLNPVSVVPPDFNDLVVNMEIGMAIVNTSSLSGSPNSVHREFLENDAYAKTWESRRLLELLLWDETKVQVRKPSPEHPVSLIKSVLQSIIKENEPSLTEKQLNYIDFHLRKAQEERLIVRWKEILAYELSGQFSVHARECPDCPMKESIEYLAQNV